jgi:hypothetical protein
MPVMMEGIRLSGPGEQRQRDCRTSRQFGKDFAHHA